MAPDRAAAASPEDTAAALNEITATVNRASSGASQASNVVQATRGNAESSGVVVRDTVTAMDAIEKSAREKCEICCGGFNRPTNRERIKRKLWASATG